MEKTRYVSAKQKTFLLEIWEVQDVHQSRNPSGVAGVYAIVRLYKEGELYFLFNKQYRIPARAWTLEFPGGKHPVYFIAFNYFLLRHC